MAFFKVAARPALQHFQTSTILLQTSLRSSTFFSTGQRLPTQTSAYARPLRQSHNVRHFHNTPGETSEPLPLEGITVITLEQAIAAPLCTRHLADLGARVIKVERPGTGDFARQYDTRAQGLSSHFVWVNRSKESLALDLKKPDHLKILKQLLKTADVLVQNLAPGASKRMGLAWEDLRKENEKIIVCDISGYGDNGPYKDKKAYDLLVQSEAGMLSVTGTPNEPAKVGISIADIAAGTGAYNNILAALLRRGKTGKGARVDISMLECMAEWMSFPLYYTIDGQPGFERSGASHASIYPYGPFNTGGNGTVMLGIQNEREWAKLCEVVLGNSTLAAEERFNSNTLRSQNRKELKDMMEKVFSEMTSKEVLAKLDEAGIANASVNDMKGLWEHPQLKARDRWTEVETPVGMIPALLPPGITSTKSVRMGKVPEVGEHNSKIMAELVVKG